MALTFAAYLMPQPGVPQRLLAVAAVAVLTAVNYRGITRTAGVARVLVALSVVALAVFVAVAAAGTVSRGEAAPGGDVPSVYGVLQSAGLLFFAFAGYARIATLGEEVREPERTIPRAIPVALGITVVIYLAVGVTALAAAGAQALAGSSRPLATAVEAVGAAWALPVVQAGAAVASLGALLALIAGVGRTALAMGRNADLPRWLASVHPRFRVPDHAELALAVAISLLVLTIDLRGAIGFSSFGVLIYYAIANAAAFTQSGGQRRWPRFLNVAGLLGCLLLVVTLPIQAVLAGVGMFAVGLAGWLLAARRRPALAAG
jgi:APA family basic amino acid/polyamine antiporter